MPLAPNGSMQQPSMSQEGGMRMPQQPMQQEGGISMQGQGMAPQGPMTPPQGGMMPPPQMPPMQGRSAPRGWRGRWMQRFGMDTKAVSLGEGERTIPNWIKGKSIVFFFVALLACWGVFGYVPEFDLWIVAAIYEKDNNPKYSR